jgi:hypothetical protein
MSIPEISQDAEEAALRWVEGDPLDLQFEVVGVDWSGDYSSHVRKYPKASSPLLLSFAVTATFNSVSGNTLFTLAAPEEESLTVFAGEYVWDLQKNGGRTRLRGPVYVEPQVTVTI